MSETVTNIPAMIDLLRSYARAGEGGPTVTSNHRHTLTMAADALAAAQKELAAVRARTVEEAATVCERRARSLSHDSHDYHAASEARKCAAAIRWLVTQPERFGRLLTEGENG